MAETVHCPECDRKLRVPDDRLGKRVKCPGCGAIFTAEAGDIEEAEVEEAPRPPRRQPVRPARAVEEDEDYAEEEQEARPRRRRRRASGRAQEAVAPAATAMLVSGIILCVIGVIYIPASFTFEASGTGSIGGVSMKDLAERIQSMGRVGGVISGLVCIAIGAVTILGAIKMKNLESYGLAMTSAILTLLPCTNVCCWGIPIGIWALVVLNRQDVKDAFG